MPVWYLIGRRGEATPNASGELADPSRVGGNRFFNVRPTSRAPDHCPRPNQVAAVDLRLHCSPRMNVDFEQATPADAEDLVEVQIAAFHDDARLYPESRSAVLRL